ncbi:MAG: 2Fe-2S iron-sulfur cluster binding domain-containing protein [Betaproteobacteria bacterium]|nr:MAG: 2Fe-2S iron-sulfur cluster binding domain-containing protein [Betaproteobacteria bacterium]
MATARTFTVNGQKYEAAIEDGETLLDVLRDKLRLTGTKKGCDAGDCGACTVLLDGEPLNSCLVLAATVGDKSITTIEGLAKNGELTPLQQAFINEGGLQCGYCTPGMVLSASALLARNPEPSAEEIKDALAGNLCRCTGYTGILNAVQRCKENRDIQSPSGGGVGTSIPRLDAADKVTGRALYTADIWLPNMAYGKLLGSPIAHGLVKRIDASKARALPGVLAVLTGADVTDTKYGVSPARYDEDVLAKDKVRHVGDPVAAVAAVDEKTAERALKLIEVDYEPLPVLTDAMEAVKEGAPLIHDRYPRNISTTVEHNFGDVEAAFKESHYVREESFTGNNVFQSPLEPHASISTWSHDGNLTLYTSTQVPPYVQYMMAHVLHIPLGKIRVIRPAVGGGFGTKAATTPLDICSALLSRACGRPVKMVYAREEMFRYGRGRHKQHMKIKLGLDREGRIKAVKSEIYLDGGAYTSFGVATAYYAGSMIPTLYKIPNYRYDGYRVMTNKPACGAMRGHGVPQPRFAFECLLSMAADDLGIDPIEIRRRNAMTPNTLTLNDLDIGSCEFTATLDAVAEKSSWKDKYGKLPRGQGIGIGCGGFVSGAGYCIYRGQVQVSHEKPREHFQKKSIFPHANAVVRVVEDGEAAVLMIGAAEIGQGSDTVLAQMCAQSLGIPVSRMRLQTSDSEVAPLDLGAYSSRVTFMAGHAVSRAGAMVLEKMKPYAAALLGCAASDVEARDATMFVRGDESRKVAWAEAARKYFNDNGPLVGSGWYKPPEGLGGDYKGATVGTSPAYSFGSSVCEVSVDMETGKVKVERFTDYHDCGRPINPLAVHGQVAGAIVMGAGETTMEGVQFADDGQLTNPNLHGYLIMTIKDAPEIFSGIVDSYEPRGPFGAKEIGEGSTLPVLGAVAHAIASATGVWIKDLPITPEKIVDALRRKELAAAAKRGAPIEPVPAK